jgi:hypothetical protein
MSLDTAAGMDKLHACKRNVILLAEAVHADLVLLDERPLDAWPSIVVCQ